jgi:hypothetical protein
MELCCQPYCRVPHRGPLIGFNQFSGSVNRERNSWNSKRECAEVVSGSVPHTVSTQWNVSAGSAASGLEPWRVGQSCKPSRMWMFSTGIVPRAPRLTVE